MESRFLQGGEILIEHDKGSCRLNIDGLDCDYCRFRRFLATAGKMNQGNIIEYEEIAGLYDGDYLAGDEFTWAERNRQILKDQFTHLLLEMADYYKLAGNCQKAVEWLKQGLIHEPLHREINYRLMETLVLTNEYVSVVKYFEIYRNDLKKKLRQEPDSSFFKLLG